MKPSVALEFIAIEKAFFSVKVLKRVSFALPTGRTLGLIGENGAGKSTLMNILGGNLQPDAGTMHLYQEAYAPRNPQEATRAGVSFIHQELNLFTNLSIAENIFLTSFPRTAGLPLINRAAISRRMEELLRQVDLPLAPDRLVETLSAGERQLVEIAKALSVDARLIIFDEPTTSLSSRETERLFLLMQRLRERGLAMIYISHILEDVLRLCDDIVVLRDGEVVGTGTKSEFSTARMITLMVGRALNQLYPERRSPLLKQISSEASPVLEVEGLSQPGIVENISFALHRGEVLGVSGLMGSGRSELARILFGLDPFQQGQIRLAGQALSQPSPQKNIQRRMAFLTENRREEGLCFEAAIADNIALVSLPVYARTPARIVSSPRLGEAVSRIRQAVRLTEKARDRQAVKTLSGGNQQKVVIAKWLLAQPDVFILDEPTRGIDVGAKFEIYRLIHELADGGAGVLVISSEIEELIGICDRILVMKRGEITDDIPRAAFDRERILRSALAANHSSAT